MAVARRRTTADLVILALTGVVATVVLVSIVGIIVLEIVRPAAEITVLASRVAGIVNTLIGVIAGYLAGRSSSTERNPR